MTTEENKEIVRRYQEASNANDLDALDALVAPNLISHNPTPGLPPGLEGGKMAHRATLAAFPDLHYHVEDLIAEGDKVVQRFTLHCTHRGVFMGLPPTGRDHPDRVSIFRLEGGKIVEHWAVQDGLALMIQLGLFRPPRGG
jgi:predicted ester cyclase